MKNPIPNIHLNDLMPYKGGKSHVPGVKKIYKLSSNENPFGPSKAVVRAYRNAVNDITVYPDPSNNELTKKLSEFYSIDYSKIICGCGSDEILHLLARAYLAGNDEAIVSENSFAVYPLAIKASGARVVRAKEKDFVTQIQSILDLVNNSTKIVFIANPNNPTGTMISYDDIIRLHNELPDDILLILDEAYAEYVHDESYHSGFNLVNDNNNVVVTRTFSKAYGLAGLRVGWAYCPIEVIDVLNRLRIPFSVNSTAQKAAVAAMNDQQHIINSVKHNNFWLPKIKHELENLGFIVTSSHCNFILIEVPIELNHDADEIYNFLCSRGIIVRQMYEYGLPNYLRLTIGLEEANSLVISSLVEFLK
jgi:histidinol-phosphate aminotransferase